MPRYAIAVLGTIMVSLWTSGLAVAQVQTLDENINNQGIPRQAPSLGLSSIYGLNPCSSGLSVGVSTPLFGIGGAKASIDRECETRNNAALAITALHDPILAREIMCKIHEVREAAERVHQPCIEDGGRVVAKSSAPVAEIPRQEAAPAAVVGPAQSSVPRRYAPAMPMRVPPPTQGSATDRVQVPAFCHTPGLDKGLYPECVPGSAASQTALARQEAAMRPPVRHAAARAPSRAVTREPAAEPRAITAIRIRAPAEIPMPPPIQADRPRTHGGCVVPSALLAAYPECRTDTSGGSVPTGTASLEGAEHG